MVSKLKQFFVCRECGSQSPKWIGQCPDCEGWNTFVAEISSNQPASRRLGAAQGYMAQGQNSVVSLSEVTVTEQARISTGMGELDRVLGGGLFPGSVILVGGDPGVGKSTILLQTLAQLSQAHACLYVTGEESLEQVTQRAQRLGLAAGQLRLLAETQVERLCQIAVEEKPQVLVIDSIQTMFTELVPSAPGAVGQVRESAALMVRFAKQTGTVLFLVGHVTKEGALAGPRVLEHMVDTVLYFEGERGGRWRMLRAVKNRFGAVNELGVFAMTEQGLREVSNPSAMFLSRYQRAVPGSVIMATWEGSRPLLVEVQALVDDSYGPNPRRITVGLEQNRLAMLLAVLHRHVGIASYNQDVFVNVVGGVRVTETAADLALLMACVSSLRDKPIAQDLMVFGEVGLSGEIRPVQSGQERLHEAAKHGFHRAIVPKANVPKQSIGDMEIIGVEHVSEAMVWVT